MYFIEKNFDMPFLVLVFIHLAITCFSSNDIVDGTVDEHALMIYLSLLKKRVGAHI